MRLIILFIHPAKRDNYVTHAMSLDMTVACDSMEHGRLVARIPASALGQQPVGQDIDSQHKIVDVHRLVRIVAAIVIAHEK